MTLIDIYWKLHDFNPSPFPVTEQSRTHKFCISSVVVLSSSLRTPFFLPFLTVALVKLRVSLWTWDWWEILLLSFYEQQCFCSSYDSHTFSFLLWTVWPAAASWRHFGLVCLRAVTQIVRSSSKVQFDRSRRLYLCSGGTGEWLKSREGNCCLRQIVKKMLSST